MVETAKPPGRVGPGAPTPKTPLLRPEPRVLEKRLPIALLLCFVVLVGWNVMFPPEPRPTEPAPVVDPAAAPGAGPVAELEPTDLIGEVVSEEEARTLTLEFGTPGQRGSYRAVFTNRGGRLAELRVGNWWQTGDLDEAERADRENWVHLLDSIDEGVAGPTASLGLRTSASSAEFRTVPLDDALWTMRALGPEDAPEGVEFAYAPGRGLRFVKRVRPVPGTYDFAVELEITNEGGARSGPATFFFTPAAVVPLASGDRFYVEPQSIAVGLRLDEPEELLEDSENRKERPKPDDVRGSLDVGDRVRFAGVHNKYFAVLLRAADEPSGATMRGAEWRRVRDEDWVRENPTKASEAWRSMATEVLLNLEVPEVGETARWDYRLYCGPKDRAELAQASPDHELLTLKDLGFFSWIATFLLTVLGACHRVVGNWGVAIILLTLSVRLVLFPVNRRSQTAMARYQKKMKRLQPRIDEVKKKYEKDPQKLRQEQAKLMQEEGAFPPLGGCLPIFVQIPIFFGLFSALRVSFDLRQAPFVLWIRDLSISDRLLELGLDASLPLVGSIKYLNVLPPLMVVLWVLQQRMMPAPADEQAARMQKMMMWMPVMMGVFLYNYAAGLSLYMITSSSFGMLETGFIKKKWPIDDTEPEKKKKSGFMARLAEAQKEQVRRLESQQRGKKAQRASSGSATRSRPKKQRKQKR